MGMYDTVVIEGESSFKKMKFNDLSLQTKDLECNMDNYVINSKKNLIKKNVKYRDRTTKEKNAYKKKWENDYGEKWVENVLRFVPSIIEKEWNCKYNYTGNLELYTYNDQCTINKYPFWLSLIATFEKGALKKLAVSNFELYEDRLKEIKKRQDDFKKSIKELIVETKGMTLDEIVTLVTKRYYIKLDVARKIASLLMTNANIDIIAETVANRFV